MKNKLTSKEAISLICIVSLCQLILNIPKIIINSCSTGSIINVLYISLTWRKYFKIYYFSNIYIIFYTSNFSSYK